MMLSEELLVSMTTHPEHAVPPNAPENPERFTPESVKALGIPIQNPVIPVMFRIRSFFTVKRMEPEEASCPLFVNDSFNGGSTEVFVAFATPPLALVLEPSATRTHRTFKFDHFGSSTLNPFENHFAFAQVLVTSVDDQYFHAANPPIIPEFEYIASSSFLAGRYQPVNVPPLAAQRFAAGCDPVDVSI